MTDEIDTLVSRINTNTEQLLGFITCKIESRIPLVLSYHFSSVNDAESFKIKRLSLSEQSEFRYVITNKLPLTVFEYR